jgi:hypothetical protein
MDKRELDLIFKVQLFAHRNNAQVLMQKNTKTKKEREYCNQSFFNGHQIPICRKTFLFAHAILANPSWNPYQSH